MKELKDIINSSVIDLMQVLDNVNKFSKRPKLLQSMFKKVIKVWSEESDKRTIQALVIIVKALKRNPDYYGVVSRSMYLTYVKNSKFIYGNSIAKNNFMKTGLLEAFSLQLDEAYKHAFVFIRQLAITVRKAFLHSSKEEIRSVYNWQFICSLKLWCEFVARHAGSNELIKSLIHPLNTIILGAIRLSPGSRWIPIRFHFVECLHLLAGIDRKLRPLDNPSESTTQGKDYTPVLVSSLPILLDVFQLFDFNKRSTAASNAAMDLRLMLHFSPSQRKQTACVDAVAAWLHDLLTESLCLYANSVAFPEYSASAISEVKNFLKSCKVANFTRNFKSLLAKVKEQNDLVRRKRSAIKSLFDQQAINNLEIGLGEPDAPLLAYYVIHRKIRVRELATLTQRFKDEGMEHMKTEDAFADEKDAIPEEQNDRSAEVSTSKKRPRPREEDSDESDESDAESDASYDIDDGKTVVHVSRSGKKSRKQKGNDDEDESESDEDDDEFDLDAALAEDEADKEQEELKQSENEDELKEFRIDDFDDSDGEEESSGKGKKKKGKKGESENERIQRLMREDPDLAGLEEEQSEEEELMDIDMDDFSSGDEDEEGSGVVTEAAPPAKVQRVNEAGQKKPVNGFKKSNKKEKKQERQKNRPQHKQGFQKKGNAGVAGKKAGKKNKNQDRKAKN